MIVVRYTDTNLVVNIRIISISETFKKVKKRGSVDHLFCLRTPKRKGTVESIKDYRSI